MRYTTSPYWNLVNFMRMAMMYMLMMHDASMMTLMVIIIGFALGASLTTLSSLKIFLLKHQKYFLVLNIFQKSYNYMGK